VKTLTIAIAASLLAASPAVAQDQTREDQLGWTPPDIVVTATREKGYSAAEANALRTPVPIIETPQSVQVLTRTLIDEQQLTTLADAARNISGVVPALPSEAVLANPIVRGFESEVFVDGLIAYGDTAVVDPSSLTAVERIEVVKGPTSLLFGGGTGSPVGGLINLITKTPVDRAIYAVSIRAGSFATVQPSVDINVPITSNIGVRFAGDYTSSDDAIDRVGIERFSLNPSFRASFGDTDLVVRGSYSDVKQLEYAGLPAAIARRGDVNPFRFSGATNAPRTQIENLMITGVLTHRFSDKLKAAVQLRRYKSDFNEFASFPFFSFFPATGPTSYPIIKGTLPVKVDEWTVDASLTVEFNTGPIEHVLLGGVQYDATDYNGATGFDFTPIGVIDYANPASDVNFGAVPALGGTFINQYRTTAVYAQDQLTIADRIHVLAGLRWTSLGIKEIVGGTNDTTRSRVDPRVGVTIDVADGIALYGGYATGSRLTLFYNGGGTPPKPETSESYEAGIKLGAKRIGLSGTIALFRQFRDNVPVASPTMPFASVQSGRQRAQGVEADIIWEPSKQWSLLANYAYTDAAVVNDTITANVGSRLPRVPEHSGRIAVRYRFTGKLNGLGIGAGVTAATASEITIPNTERGDSFAVVDAQASYQTGRFRIGVSVENLFDQRYFIPYQYLNQAVVRPGTPRSAFVTLGVGF
jgi:iron complex outermembrane recepter protein